MVFKHFFLLCIACFLGLGVNSYAQKADIRGRVLDKATHEPIAYANILVLTERDSLVKGTITDEKGVFRITRVTPGNYSIKISFIGYNSVILKDKFLNTEKNDLGDIVLEVLAENLKEVVVKSSRPPLTYKVDRKVIDARSFPGADVAMDLLENVPSVQLSFDGKLTYRGDGTFKVYINGNPTPNGEEKLRQIPANQIDRMEIITNPSAKYDSEGTAGIIQVILKKNRLEGYNITSTLKLDSRGEYYGLFSVDKKGEKSGWYIQGQLSRYIWEKYSENEYQKVESENKVYETTLNTDHKNRENKSYIELGFNHDFTEKDYINFSGYIYPSKTKKYNKSKGVVHESIAELSNVTDNGYDYLSELNYNYQYVGATLSYDHKFNKERTHLLSLYMDYAGYLRDLEERQIDSKIYTTHTERVGYMASEENETIFVGKLSYKLPIHKNITLESGLNINIDDIPKATSTSGTFDDKGVITKFANEPLNQSVYFNQKIYSAFLTLETEWKRFALLVGGRLESTHRQSDYSYDLNGQRITIPSKNNFTDFFPTFHLSYSLDESESAQLYGSYSKRIHRPDYWSLLPMEQYQSLYSYYKGNGDLKPAHSNAYEVGYKKSWNRDFIAAEIFWRNTSDVTQDYARVDSSNVLMYSPENVGKSTNIGVELMAGVDVFTWWNVNFSSSLFSYRLKVDFESQHNTVKSLRYSGRINNTIKLPQSFTFRWDLSYRSPIHDAQRKRDGYFVSNISVRKGFLNNRWAAVIAYNNVFSTLNYHTISKNDADFYINNYYKEKPFVSLRIIYSFNNQK